MIFSSLVIVSSPRCDTQCLRSKTTPPPSQPVRFDLNGYRIRSDSRPYPVSSFAPRRRSTPRRMGPICWGGVDPPNPLPGHASSPMDESITARQQFLGPEPSRLEHRTAWHDPRLEIAPQRHQHLARERDDGDPAHPPRGDADALSEPL